MRLQAASSADAVFRLPRGSPLRALARSSIGVAAAALVVLVPLSFVLRVQELSGRFWIDEGLSVGIASHALTDIPGLLRQDGSPPLYYLLLHEWIRVFGEGEAATHALSLLFALLVVPAALWAGWSLFGRRAGLICGTLAAVNPLLSAYAQETRMYSMVAFLGLVAAASLVHVFAYRRRRYVFLLAPALAAMLYTHNWSGFFCLGAVLAVTPALVAARPPDRRALLVDAAIAFGGAVLLFLPWVPTLVFQAAHTGAPWASHPHMSSLVHAPYFVVGSSQIGMALLLGAGAGVVAVVERGRRSPEAVAAAGLILLTFGSLGIAWLYSQATLAWAPRYLTILIGPLLLLSALGLARARRLGLVAAAVVVWLSIGLTGHFATSDKSNVAQLAHRFQHRIRPGELAISTQPEQVATLRYYMPEGLRYETSMGPQSDPGVMDWRDAVDRLRTTRAATRVPGLVGGMNPGERLLLVSPVTRNSGWDTRWTRLVKIRSKQWERALARDGRLDLLAHYRPAHRSDISTAQAFLYARRR
jgi:mannosyltransferase